jgi:uncharacterized protein (TIGR02265 family)
MAAARGGRVVKCPVARHQPSIAPPDRFLEPPWDAPLDTAVALAAIPKDAEISGMFTAPLVTGTKRVIAEQEGARERYVAFRFYPLREHAAWLLDAARTLYPDRSLRSALRKLGRGAPDAFLTSTLGKVMLDSSLGLEGLIDAFAKAYELNLRPGSVRVSESQPRRVVVKLDQIHYFLDCHHVGVFEGLMKHAGTRGRVRIDSRSLSSADLLLEW